MGTPGLQSGQREVGGNLGPTTCDWHLRQRTASWDRDLDLWDLMLSLGPDSPGR